MKNKWKEDIAQKDYIWTSCRPQPSSHLSILPPEACAAYATLWTSLLSVNPTGPSGRGRGLAIGRGNAGRLSGVKASSNITRELTGATELQGRIRSWLFTFCLFVFLVFFLCALGTQSVVCKDPDRTSGPQPLTKLFGIQTTS